MIPEQYFEKTQQAFFDEVSHTGKERRFEFTLAGRKIELHFAGSRLFEEITRPFSHLCSNRQEEPSLTVFIWDEASSNSKLPERPWSLDSHTNRGEIKGFNTSQFRTAYGRGHMALNMLDQERNIGLFCTKSADTIIPEFWGCPLVTILSWWATKHGLQFAHAGAVGTEDGGVLLVGTGGSGKSATTLSCLLSNFYYLSDDYCFLSNSNSTQVCSAYCTGKLEKAFLNHYPELQTIASIGKHPDSKKAVFQLMPDYRSQLKDTISLRAVLIPKVTDTTTTKVVPTGFSEVLLRLAPNVLFQIPGAGPKELRALKEYLKDLPAYRLILGSDWNAPRVIRRLIGELV